MKKHIPHTTPPALDAEQLLRDLTAVAAGISQDTRSQVAREQADFHLYPPVENWTDAAERATDPRLSRAARALPRLADAATRPGMRRATVRLVEAIRRLAAWGPVFEEVELVLPEDFCPGTTLPNGEVIPATATTWSVTAASLELLDDLRDEVRVRLAELIESHRGHPDAASWLVAVLRRATPVRPTEADRRLDGWLARFQQADPAS